MKNPALHFAGRRVPNTGALCCLIEIFPRGHESFDDFGFSFERGVLDKRRFFQYNMVREIVVFRVAGVLLPAALFPENCNLAL